MVLIAQAHREGDSGISRGAGTLHLLLCFSHFVTHRTSAQITKGGNKSNHSRATDDVLLPSIRAKGKNKRLEEFHSLGRKPKDLEQRFLSGLLD